MSAMLFEVETVIIILILQLLNLRFSELKRFAIDNTIMIQVF